MSNEQERWLSCIMVDIMDWGICIGPTHIIGKNMSLINVYIGKPPAEYEKNNNEIAVGIYVDSVDYEKINHTKTYVFIHDPTLNNPNNKDIIRDLITMIDDTDTFFDDVKFEDSIHRNHYHVLRN